MCIIFIHIRLGKSWNKSFKTYLILTYLDILNAGYCLLKQFTVIFSCAIEDTCKIIICWWQQQW